MKKIILALTFVLLLTGCSAADNGLAKNEKVLTKEEYKNCYNIINLTPDNWKDYIEIGEYTDPVDNTVALTYGLKEEYKENLCGQPEIDISFLVDFLDKSGDYNADTNEMIYEWSNEERSESFDEYYYPKTTYSRNDDRYYSKDYIIVTHQEYDNGYDDYHGCNTKSVYDKEVRNVSVTAISGSLCYANIADDMYNTNSANERYICFDADDGTRYSLFENGLVRWDRGTGFGYYNYSDIYQNSYYTFFKD